jgi:putative ABC transport system substrate-binding protein
MKRRDFLTLVGSAAAQSTPGYLSGWSSGDAPEYLDNFRKGLPEAGYVEGRNVGVEYRLRMDIFNKYQTRSLIWLGVR